MAIPHAKPGVPVDLRPHTDELSEHKAQALVKTDGFEAMRLAIPRGHEVCKNHQLDGPLTVHCLQGRVEFTAEGETRELAEGSWLFLPGGVPHTIIGAEDSLLLLTILFR